MTGLVPFNRKRSDFLNTNFDDFYNVLDDFFTGTTPARRSLAGDSFKIDVQEDERDYFVTAELPGIKKEEIELGMEEGRLQISIKRDEKKEDNTKNYIHKERRYCSMHRSIYLVDAGVEGITAKFENGVLDIKIPKKAKPDKSFKIAIE